MLEEGTRWNWFDDATIRQLRLDCRHLAGVLFVVAQPDLRAARSSICARCSNRNFAVGCFLSFVTGIGIFTTIYLTPLFLGYVRGFSAWQIGIAIFSTGVASLVGMPVYILLARKLRYPLADDVRPRVVRLGHVELQLHHP